MPSHRDNHTQGHPGGNGLSCFALDTARLADQPPVPADAAVCDQGGNSTDQSVHGWGGVSRLGVSKLASCPSGGWSRRVDGRGDVAEAARLLSLPCHMSSHTSGIFQILDAFGSDLIIQLVQVFIVTICLTTAIKQLLSLPCHMSSHTSSIFQILDAFGPDLIIPLVQAFIVTIRQRQAPTLLSLA